MYINLTGEKFESLKAAQDAGAATINYGIFLNAIINFLIVAFTIFIMVRIVSKMHRKEDAAPAAPTTKECPFCATIIAIKATRCPNCTSELKKS